MINLANTNVENDKRLKEIQKQQKADIKESNKLYNGMINEGKSYFQAQQDATEQWGQTQEQLQQQQTDFTIETIEQQKNQALQNLQKEQRAAYSDYQKQADPYGARAEELAAAGLSHSGFSESSLVQMYNQYQQRVATAKQDYNQAVLSFDNSIKEAQLQNSSALALLSYQTFQQSLALSLQRLQYGNDLLLQKAEAKRGIKDNYYARYQNTVNQINEEKALAESIRQYNESLKEEKRQFNETLALQKKKSKVSSSGGSGGGNISKSKKMLPNIKDAERDNGQASKKAALNKAKSVKTKQDAQKLLNSLGIKSGISIIDSVTWNKAKRLGDGGSDIQNFKNYASYLQAYCVGVINGKF